MSLPTLSLILRLFNSLSLVALSCHRSCVLFLKGHPSCTKIRKQLWGLLHPLQFPLPPAPHAVRSPVPCPLPVILLWSCPPPSYLITSLITLYISVCAYVTHPPDPPCRSKTPAPSYTLIPVYSRLNNRSLCAFTLFRPLPRSQVHAPPPRGLCTRQPPTELFFCSLSPVPGSGSPLDMPLSTFRRCPIMFLLDVV